MDVARLNPILAYKNAINSGGSFPFLKQSHDAIVSRNYRFSLLKRVPRTEPFGFLTRSCSDQYSEPADEGLLER